MGASYRVPGKELCVTYKSTLLLCLSLSKQWDVKGRSEDPGEGRSSLPVFLWNSTRTESPDRLQSMDHKGVGQDTEQLWRHHLHNVWERFITI